MPLKYKYYPMSTSLINILCLLIDSPTGEWQWESIDGSVCVPLPPPSVSGLVSCYDLCVTGEGLTKLTLDPRLLNALLPHVRVFARVSPKQKVSILLKWSSVYAAVSKFV